MSCSRIREPQGRSVRGSDKKEDSTRGLTDHHAQPHPGSFVGFDIGEKEACLEAQPAQTAGQNRHVQSGKTEQNDESGTIPDTQQVPQTQPPPIRVKAAPSNLGQTLPSGFFQ